MKIYILMVEGYNFDEQIEAIYTDPVLAEGDLEKYISKFNRWASIIVREIQEKSLEILK